MDAASGRRRADGPHRARGVDPFDLIEPSLASADLAVVNSEMVISDRGVPADKTFVFRSPPSAAQRIASAGIDVANLANNHAKDLRLVRFGGHSRVVGSGRRCGARRGGHRRRRLPLPGSSRKGNCERRIRGRFDDRPLGFPRRRRLGRYRVGPPAVSRHPKRTRCRGGSRRGNRGGPLGHRTRHLP